MDQDLIEGVKTVAITGGTRRLGLAIARHFGSLGWRLVLGYRQDAAAAEEARTSLAAVAPSVRVMACDTAEESDVNAFVDSIATEEGRLDFLLHNVGRYAPKPAVDVTAEDWRATLGANLDGGFFCARAGFPLLRASRGLLGLMGYSGLEALRADPETMDYQVSKVGLLSLVRTLAVAWGPAGVRVAMVSPGHMANSIDLPADRAAIPIPRWGEPADICAAWDYLLGADYVTGVNIDVAGGFRL